MYGFTVDRSSQDSSTNECLVSIEHFSLWFNVSLLPLFMILWKQYKKDLHQMFVNVFGLEMCWVHACSSLMCPTWPRIPSSVSLLLEMKGLRLRQRSGRLPCCFEVRENVRAKSKLAGANPVSSPNMNSWNIITFSPSCEPLSHFKGLSEC